MTLTPGTRLGPYEIVAALGAGGMGEVYRARDTRLDRTVALKVLSAAIAADPQFRERFEREAKSTDIWALGCVLYEMLTGKKAFEGSSHASVIAAIMTAEAPTGSSQSIAAPLLDHVVKRCLAKSVDERWQNAGDVMHELKWIAESGAVAASQGAGAAPIRRQRMWPTVATLLALMAATLALPYFLSRPTKPSVIRLSLELPADVGVPLEGTPVAPGMEPRDRPGWEPGRVCCDEGGEGPIMAALHGLPHSPASAGHRRRICPLLVAGRPLDRLLRRR